MVTSPALKHFLASGEGTIGAFALTSFWRREASLEASLAVERAK